jgi:hypothetical protein
MPYRDRDIDIPLYVAFVWESWETVAEKPVLLRVSL